MSVVEDFLLKIKMHPNCIDIDKTAESFIDEMNRGLEGVNSSLRMIPTYLKAEGNPENHSPIICIDAGGTNLRTGLVTIIDGTVDISHYEKTAMPGSHGEIGVDMFFSQLAEKIYPLTKYSNNISFCFSYPAEIFSNGDGKIIQLNKEVRVKDSEGVVIGKTLIEYLQKLGAKKDFNFTLLNDTTAGLLGGIAVCDMSACDGYAGFILGTGCNSCYYEKGSRIKKLTNAENMIINCESGVFDKLVRGEADFLTDNASDIPGDHQLEKMVSGAYLGKLVTNICILASEEKILSNNFSKISEPFTSMELDDFLRGKPQRISVMCVDRDGEYIREIIDLIFERAARICCANIEALCIHCDGGKTANKPFGVVAEGSTFYNSLLFKEKFDKLLKDYCESKKGRFIKCYRADNSTMAGAALAAVLNCTN